MNIPANSLRISFIVLPAILMVGCDGVAHQDLRQWMKKEEAAVVARVQPIDEPKAFVPQVYDSLGDVEPFDSNKLLDVLRAQISSNSGSSALLEAEQRRRQEPLEGYPLDTISFVGFLEKDNVPTALVRVNGLIYRVKTGNYVGKNYGLVRSVSESEILIREIVQDTIGEWIERDTTLFLEEDDA